MTIQHKDIPDAQRHEPKGISTAVAGANYYANGFGVGNWVRYQGWGQYEDSRRIVGSPAQTIATGVRTKFVCNGAYSTIERLPSDAAVSIWDTSNNKHVPIDEFDVYHVRVAFTAENYAGATPYLVTEVDVGGSIGVIYTNTQPLLKSGNAQAITLSFPVYTGATYFANGGEIYLTYTGTGSCDIYKNSILIVRESKNFV